MDRIRYLDFPCVCVSVFVYCMCIDRTKEVKDREGEKAEKQSLPGNLRIDKVTSSRLQPLD